ncbi:MAG: alpha/beta fold hydrolase [Rhizobiales bacterium]|nr:alpha/beta fold hydrolase [Hyphomicrobiales bacterium]
MPWNTLSSFALVIATLVAVPANADVRPYPSNFSIREIQTNGTMLHVRIGGSGPAVVLLHGFADTGDMWEPLAATLASDHMVIVPDLRGMGLSTVPGGGFEKKNQAKDIAGVLDTLHVARADIVGHNIGNMVAFAFAERYPERTTRLVMMDAPVPGIGPWDDILKSPLLWHFRFGGPDMERLVAGRERIYLDRFWNDFAADPAKFDEKSRAHYADLYAKPGRMHAGFAQFAAFDQDVIDNRKAVGRGRLQMPVLAIGGDHSLGSTMAYIMRFAADNVREVVVKDSGHWLMEEQPKATIAAIVNFLSGASAVNPRALSVAEMGTLAKNEAGAGTSGVEGIQTIVLSGDPAKAGPYAIQLKVPAHTNIAAHTHRDNRFGMVVSGEWHFGYGQTANAAATTALGPGGFYTEPAGMAHFAFTGDQPTIVYITGQGPSDTNYVSTARH